jgi:hypothetical protein
MINTGRPAVPGKPGIDKTVSGKTVSAKTISGKTIAGKTRICPHCKGTILDSASICPACHHHLRFDPTATAEQRAQSSFSPLRVDGTIRHPAAGEAWEYSVVLSISNERGEEITRRVLGVGALQPDEQRNFSLSVEVFAPQGAKMDRPK